MRDAEVNSRSVRVAISCSIGIMLASGTAITGTFGIFMLPILREFHWGRAQISGVVMTMYDGRTKLANQVVSEVREHFGGRVKKADHREYGPADIEVDHVDAGNVADRVQHHVVVVDLVPRLRHASPAATAIRG